MAAAYTKDFLISAYLSRFVSIDPESFSKLEVDAERFYDEVGRDRFRVYASLDANAIRAAKETGFCT
jgi:hypothetical protein